MKNVWEALSQGVSRANTAIYYIGQFDQNATTEQYINEARFLRAYYMYLINDLYGQVPFREADELDFSVTPRVMDRKEAADFIIEEVKATSSLPRPTMLWPTITGPCSKSMWPSIPSLSCVFRWMAM